MNYIIKCALIGDYGVGKSSIVSRYIDDTFYHSITSTIGVDFRHKVLDYKENIYKLQIWDTAGQEKFESIVKSYIRDLDVCILVFDVNSLSSFKKLDRWLYLVKHISEKHHYIYLVGNKSDKDLREVSIGDINKFCLDNNLEYLECSAKKKKI